jgi:hypothetical protein
MLEKTLEKKCGAAAKKAGALFYKWSSPSVRGVPDRILIKEGGEVIFIEMKRPGAKATKLQQSHIKQINLRGGSACVIDDYDAFLRLLEDPFKQFDFETRARALDGQ